MITRKTSISMIVLFAFIFAFIIGSPAQSKAHAASNLDANKSYQSDEWPVDWRSKLSRGWIEVIIYQKGIADDGNMWVEFSTTARGNLWINSTGIILGEMYGQLTSYGSLGGIVNANCIYIVGWDFYGHINKSGHISLAIDEYFLPGFCRACGPIVGCIVEPQSYDPVGPTNYGSEIQVGETMMTVHNFSQPNFEASTVIYYEHVTWTAPSGTFWDHHAFIP